MSPRTLATLRAYRAAMARSYGAALYGLPGNPRMRFVTSAVQPPNARTYRYNEESYGPLPSPLAMFTTGMPASQVWAYGWGN